jgi:hypothetical protein
VGNEDPKQVILRRRAHFVALALASAGVVATSGQACGGDTNADTSNQEADANPQPCLSQPRDDSSVPQPCLGRPYPEDAGEDGDPQADASDAGSVDSAVEDVKEIDVDVADTGPRPCLTPAK